LRSSTSWQPLALECALVRAGAGAGVADLERLRGAAAAHQRDRLVVRDRQQPGAQVARRVVAPQCPQRAEHRVLRRVRGLVVIAQHPEAAGMHRALVAHVEGGEGGIAARLRLLHQVLVAELAHRHRHDLREVA
jgi:hypothetical protein